MKLKEIDIQGFKSFYSKFNFQLDNNLIGIIGPNGSGKSNIIDAIRWTLGEQSAKNLRGSNMQDIIFSGTEEKNAKNFAEVSLTFHSKEDNEKKIITRRLYKNGDSEYLFNGKKSKLKDISDIYLDLGINKESYSIITQGKVENIISSKPQDRRIIIEEAAGVLKYKNKRKETYFKLEKTNENLTRLNDIFIEIENRNNILEEQKNKAESYIKIRDELKEKDIITKVYDIKHLSIILEEYNSEINSLNNNRNFLNNKYEELSKKLLDLKTKIKNIDLEYDNLKNNELDSIKTKERLQYEITLFEEKTKNKEQLKEKLELDLSKLENKKANLEKKIKELEINLKNNIEKKSLIEKNIKRLENANFSNIEEIERKIDDLKENYFNIITTESKLQNELELINKLKKNTNIDLENLNNDISYQKNDLTEKTNLLKNLKENIVKNETKLKKLLTLIANLKTSKEINNKKRLDILDNISKGNNLLLNFKNKKEFLENQTNNLNYYNIGVKEILASKNDITGIHSTLGDIIKVEKKYATAIDTALATAQQNIIVDTAEIARVCVEKLKNSNKGRATFLPLDNIKEKNIDTKILEMLKKCDGFIGIASNLVTYNTMYRNIVSNILGLTIIVDNLYNGNLISKKIFFKYKIVTLDGQVINSGGSITGGSTYKNNNSIIKNKIEFDELDTNILKIENKLSKLKEELSLLDNEIINTSKEIEVKNEEKYTFEITLKECNLELKNLEDAISILSNSIKIRELKLQNLNKDYSFEKEKNIKEELEKIKKQLADINCEIEILNNSKINQKNDDSFLKEELSKEKINKYILIDNNKVINSNLLELQEELKNIDLEILELKNNYNLLLNSQNDNFSVKDKAKKLDEVSLYLEKIKVEIEKIIKLKNEIYIKENNYNEELNFTNLELTNINEKLEKINFNFAKKELQLDDNINYLLEKYSTTYEREVYRLEEISIEELSKYKNIVKDLQNKLKSFGNVNLNSIEEFKEINDRYLFYKKEIDDLVSSKEQLYSTIKEIDKEVTDRFLRTFNKISINFDKIYRNLFNGGYAKITLEDDKDVLNCGINIEVSPPGKKLQKITLLSGGEKALTAISLLFAILEIKNPPFVILDEVEAALDEDNVYKFAKFLKHYSINNQFIVITHRRGTMEVMDKIYGITMKEKGISYVLPLELKNILEENYIYE